MLRFDKMTVKAQEALQEAQEIAARHENQSVEPIHLLAALVQQPDGVVPPLLARVGIRSDMLSQEIEREIGRLPKVQGFAQQHLGRALNESSRTLSRRLRNSRTSTSRPNICSWPLPEPRSAIQPANS